jgi:hypothetical protein
MMPSPTATTTGRGSFACDHLAISAKASSDMSPAGGGVAGNLLCMPAGCYLQLARHRGRG